MDLADIKKLVRLMEQAELTELEIDDSNKGLRVHLKRGSRTAGGETLLQPVVQVVPGGAAQPSSGGAPASPGTAAPALPATPAGPPAGTVAFPSPMVGTFYRAATPDAEPFVVPGKEVGEDSVLCIIEAMKVMNEIRSEMKGQIVEVLVENGEPVEFGQPLFLIKPT